VLKKLNKLMNTYSYRHLQVKSNKNWWSDTYDLINRCHRTIVSNGDDVTSSVKLFHTDRATATGKGRSPIVECEVLGTTNDDADSSSTEFSREYVRWCNVVLTAKREHCQTVILLSAGLVT